MALAAPPILMNPGPEYGDDTRLFQGIPGIERAPNGRLWATWYAGGDTEGPLNYCALATSGDDGKTWSTPTVIASTDNEKVWIAYAVFFEAEPGVFWICTGQGNVRLQIRAKDL